MHLGSKCINWNLLTVSKMQMAALEAAIREPILTRLRPYFVGR